MLEDNKAKFTKIEKFEDDGGIFIFKIKQFFNIF